MIAGIEYLSIQRVTGNRRPHVPDNTQRLQAFRAYQPVQFGNALLCGTQYARDAVPGLGYDDELRDGFALKYGAL